MSITSQFQSTLPVWGGTLPSGFSMAFSMMFQSTLPVWGGTPVFCRLPATRWRFNPPSPCGEGLKRKDGRWQEQVFQSTLPVWGGTSSSSTSTALLLRFQSTLPVWGGTSLEVREAEERCISIHPPRVGRDVRRLACRPAGRFISIHPPRVGRDSKSSQKFFVNFCARR